MFVCVCGVCLWGGGGGGGGCEFVRVLVCLVGVGVYFVVCLCTSGVYLSFACVHHNSKNNRSGNLKLEHINSDKFDIFSLKNTF